MPKEEEVILLIQNVAPNLIGGARNVIIVISVWTPPPLILAHSIYDSPECKAQSVNVRFTRKTFSV